MQPAAKSVVAPIAARSLPLHETAGGDETASRSNSRSIGHLYYFRQPTMDSNVEDNRVQAPVVPDRGKAAEKPVSSVDVVVPADTNRRSNETPIENCIDASTPKKVMPAAEIENPIAVNGRKFIIFSSLTHISLSIKFARFFYFSGADEQSITSIEEPVAEVATAKSPQPDAIIAPVSSDSNHLAEQEQQDQVVLCKLSTTVSIGNIICHIALTSNVPFHSIGTASGVPEMTEASPADSLLNVDENVQFHALRDRFGDTFNVIVHFIVDVERLFIGIDADDLDVSMSVDLMQIKINHSAEVPHVQVDKMPGSTTSSCCDLFTLLFALLLLYGFQSSMRWFWSSTSMVNCIVLV